MAGRQRFLGNRQVVGGRQRFTGHEPQQEQTKPEHHGKSLLGSFASDLYDTAVHSPSGLYQTAKAATHDFDVAASHVPLVNKDPYFKKRAHEKSALAPIAKATAKSLKEDVQHPLRHPGNTFLDALSVLSLGAGTAARVGEVGRLARTGETTGEIARAAVKGPRPTERVIHYNGEKVSSGQYSRSALRRGSQKLVDRFQERFPDTKLPIKNLHERVGHELKQNRRITEDIAKAPAADLAKTRLSKPELKAVQVAAEGVPIEKRIAFHEQQLENFKPHQTKLIAATKKEIGLLRAARRHVVENEGLPRIDPRNHKLVGFFQKAHAIAHAREEELQGSQRLVRDKPGGKVVRQQALTDEQIAGRLAEPAKVMGHVVSPEDVPSLFRFPYKAEQSKAAVFKPQGFKGSIPIAPGSVTKGFEGKLLKSGAFRNDTGKLVAESYLEAHRFAAVMKHRDQFLKMAHDVQETEHDVPIRTDALLNRSWPKVIQDISERPSLSKSEADALNNHFEDLRSNLFPKIEDVERELARGEHPEVKWIDKRVLGGLDEPNPSVAGSTRRFVNVFDHINNASRAAILYLKPAYAVPNILGNTALNMVQQGFAFPTNVARSARLWWKLQKEDPQLWHAAKLAMGEGISSSLEAERGIGTRAINKAAHLWQKPVDTPFRWNALTYEMKRAGYPVTVSGLRNLFSDEKKFLPVVREANAAIIDYGNLNPFEQSVVRRVIFFYPWVKGSTRYAGRFLTTHPTQAAVLGQAGKVGAKQDQQDLGPLPSYAEGLFKVGQRGNTPLTINPTSAGILQTPAEIGKSLAELTSGNPGEAFTFAQNLTPALAALLALAGASQRRRGQSPAGAAKDQLVGGLPLLTLIQQLQNPPSESRKPRLYPRTREDALMHFLLGGLAPTPLNKRRAEQAKYLEDHPR